MPGCRSKIATRVFERFVRLASDPRCSDEEKRGPGIGLYVVKGLVEAHGGSVSVERRAADEGGSGARFVVKLPDPSGNRLITSMGRKLTARERGRGGKYRGSWWQMSATDGFQ